MKKLVAGLAIMFSALSYAEGWEVGDQIVITKGENTDDVLAINICISALTFGANANNAPDGTTIPINAQMRIDSISPWELSMTARVVNGVLLGQVELKKELLEELVNGSKLRVKWGENVISRFNLEGLTSALKKVKCDSQFFEEQKNSDSDYFT